MVGFDLKAVVQVMDRQKALIQVLDTDYNDSNEPDGANLHATPLHPRAQPLAKGRPFLNLGARKRIPFDP